MKTVEKMTATTYAELGVMRLVVTHARSRSGDYKLFVDVECGHSDVPMTRTWATPNGSITPSNLKDLLSWVEKTLSDSLVGRVVVVQGPPLV